MCIRDRFVMHGAVKKHDDDIKINDVAEKDKGRRAEPTPPSRRRVSLEVRLLVLIRRDESCLRSS